MKLNILVVPVVKGGRDEYQCSPSMVGNSSGEKVSIDTGKLASHNTPHQHDGYFMKLDVDRRRSARTISFISCVKIYKKGIHNVNFPDVTMASSRPLFCVIPEEAGKGWRRT